MKGILAPGVLASVILVLAGLIPGRAQSPDVPPAREPLPPALSEGDSERVKDSVDRGLAWLAAQIDQEVVNERNPLRAAPARGYLLQVWCRPPHSRQSKRFPH